MAFSGYGHSRAGLTVGLTTALRCFVFEVRSLWWQLLLVGNGLWLGAAICGEHFVVDLAESLEQRAPRAETAVAGRRGWRILGSIRRRLVGAVRWCQPGAKAWRRLAVRMDVALLKQRGSTAGRGGQAA